MPIFGNHIGGAITPNTYEILGDDGTTIILAATPTGSEVLLTATENDVRQGKTFASDNGISVGSKNIPGYITTRSYVIIKPNSNFSIKLSGYDRHNYTELQCLISKNNTKYSIDKVVLDNKVFSVPDGNQLSTVTKNDETMSVDLNITNDSSDYYRIYYFTFKED